MMAAPLCRHAPSLSGHAPAAPARPQPACRLSANAPALRPLGAPRRRKKAAAAATGGGADPATSALAETAALDGLIDSLLAARGAEELASRVADNIMSFDQRFGLRVATRSDTAGGAEEKEALASLAKVVMQLVDAMVKQTNEQLSESSSLLQDILTAAADEATGEWSLPLAPERVAAMGAVMDANADRLDEALLSNCYAWLRKASEENMEGARWGACCCAAAAVVGGGGFGYRDG